VNPKSVEKISKGGGYASTITNGSINWSPQDEGFILHNINLYVKHSSSIVMIGKVGLGKSAFLSCILGEMEKFKESAK
jgi:ABC-type transport system involved in cytochrome bd biosynthesis fused ATPase/permease subunit